MKQLLIWGGALTAAALFIVSSVSSIHRTPAAPAVEIAAPVPPMCGAGKDIMASTGGKMDPAAVYRMACDREYAQRVAEARDVERWGPK